MVDDSLRAIATPQKHGTDEDQVVSPALTIANNIPECCMATIQEHVRYNPMMVCGHCKNIIKCFDNERAFQNYLIFCQSRRRNVLTGLVNQHWTVAFRSYETFHSR
ncbi:MAG: hypothetical protein RL011_1676 [Pseudomonadota bacterium]|jgi:hypothetical protein